MSVVSDIETQARAIEDKTTELRAHLSSRPSSDVTKDEQLALLERIKNIYHKSMTVTTAGSSNIISQKISVVRELSDRYFELDSADIIYESDIQYEESVFTDDFTGNTVSEVYAGGSSDLPSSVSITTSLNTPSTRKARQSENIGVQQTAQLISELNDSLSYEIWACVLLDIAEAISEIWSLISDLIAKLQSFIYNIQSLLNGAVISYAGGASSLLNMAQLNKSISIDIPVGTVGSELLGLSGSLSSSQRAGAGGICGIQASKMCDIKGAIEDMRVSLVREMKALNFYPQVEINITPFNETLNVLNSIKLEYNSDVLKFNKDICAYVYRRMRGVPKKIARIEMAIAAIYAATGALAGLTFGDSPTLDGIKSKLSGIGADALTDALDSGDLEYFFNGQYLSSFGRDAETLYDRSMQDANARSAIATRRVAAIASVMEDKVSAPIRIRDSVRMRYSSKRQENLEKRVKTEVSKNG